MVKSACKSSGLSGQSLYSIEAPGSISTPPTPLDGMLVHHSISPSIKFADKHLYTWVGREVQKHNKMSPAGLESRTLNLESSALTRRPQHLSCKTPCHPRIWHDFPVVGESYWLNRSVQNNRRLTTRYKMQTADCGLGTKRRLRIKSNSS